MPNLLRYTQDCLSAAEGRWPASGEWSRHRDGLPPAPGPARKRPVSIRLFENAFVERFLARAHPITPILWFGPVIAYGLTTGARAFGVGAALGLFVAGWLAWTLLEYVFHRFLFHLGAHDEAGRLRSFMMHGYHHEFPNDRMRLVAPPLMSWTLAAAVVSLYTVALGFDRAVTLFAGTAAGYVAYDWIHYYTHHFKPRNAVGRWLKRYHLLHHFDDTWDSHRFGISSPLWDLVFGTYRPASARATGAAAPRADAPAVPPPS